MKALVVSSSLGMIPFAWRLVLEGHDVQLIVLQDSAESAWNGLEQLPRRLVGEDKRNVEKKAEAVREADCVVTDSARFADEMRVAGFENVFGPVRLAKRQANMPAVTVGAWFDGEAMRDFHLLVADNGLWPGGTYGAGDVGGLTMVTPAPGGVPGPLQGVVDAAIPLVQPGGYRGLVRIGLEGNGGGGLRAEDIYTGWGWLHAHAFVSGLGDGGPGLGEVLAGAAPARPHRFTTVIPVSMAPWPGMTARQHGWPRLEIGQSSLGGDVFFHAIQFQHGKVWTGAPQRIAEGGLVGVARGSANSLTLARSRAVANAQVLGQSIREPQLRVDVGDEVEGVLAALEARGLGLL